MCYARAMRDPETVVRGFCAMWPERNVERFLEYFTDDAVYHNMLSGHRLRLTRRLTPRLLVLE